MSKGEAEGACRCEKVRFIVRGAPALTFACHTGCRRMTASAFSLNSLYAAEQFKVTQGETVLGALRGPAKQHFCASCLSWLFTVPEGMEAYVVVRSTLLEDCKQHRPFVDMWRKEGMGWVDSGAERRFDAVPEEDQFPKLVADYAAWDERVTK